MQGVKKFISNRNIGICRTIVKIVLLIVNLLAILLKNKCLTLKKNYTVMTLGTTTKIKQTTTNYVNFGISVGKDSIFYSFSFLCMNPTYFRSKKQLLQIVLNRQMKGLSKSVQPFRIFDKQTDRQSKENFEKYLLARYKNHMILKKHLLSNYKYFKFII